MYVCARVSLFFSLVLSLVRASECACASDLYLLLLHFLPLWQHLFPVIRPFSNTHQLYTQNSSYKYKIAGIVNIMNR